MYWWDGCQVSINGTKPQRCIPYGGYSTKIDQLMKHKILGVVRAFKKNALDLAMLYYEGPDAEGHSNGPDSQGTDNAVRKVDQYLWDLQTALEIEGLLNEVNIVVVSDHGMTRVGPKSTRLIRMDDLVNERDVHIMLDKGPFAMLHPKPGREKKVLMNLFMKKPKGLKVFTKQSLPDEWHFKNNELVAPIVLVAQEGHYILPFVNPKKTLPGNHGPPTGVHGYDPMMPDMWGIFYARGPAVQGGKGGPNTVRMVDIYNLMCYMLGIEPAPNSGSWSELKRFVNPKYDPVMYDRLK
ncbi:hypothetical protein MTO96_048697 [Rhipicephalus appendiculatus]